MADYISGKDKGVDWMDQLLHTGVTQNYKVAVSKGNENTQTYFSANYMDQTGVVRDTQSKRYAVKLNIHNKLFDWLERRCKLWSAPKQPHLGGLKLLACYGCS